MSEDELERRGCLGQLPKEPELEVISWQQFKGISGTSFYLLGIIAPQGALKLNVTFRLSHCSLFLLDLVTL